MGLRMGVRSMTTISNGTVSRNRFKDKEEEIKELAKPVFEYEGEKIVIPEKMSLTDAREVIDRQIKEESVKVNLNETIRAFPLDGAVALMRVLKKRYGWANLVPTMNWWGPQPPSMVGIEIGPNAEDRIQVPWGNMQVPNIEGTITTSYTFDNGMPLFSLQASVFRRDERIVAAIANEVREEVKINSIYRGKAIKINFRDSDGDRVEFNPQLAPKFIDLATHVNSAPIFSKSIEDAIRLNVINPIRFKDRFVKSRVSLKAGILLGGPYGTGKTLTAFQIANECIANDWTFLYLEDVRDLDLAINFAKLYQPCVLFAEDVDKAVSGGRTSEMDRILNTIDGVESKGDQAIITVLTTNCLGNINPAFIRPGRIDTVIEVTPPDADAALRIVRNYVSSGGGILDGDEVELKKAIRPLIGANAAFFRTTVEAAKKSAMERSDNLILTINATDLATAAAAMVPHCKLLNPNHGEKSLLEIGEAEVDPVSFAADILLTKVCETFVGQLVSPKSISKIFKKSMRSGGNPSQN